MSLQHPGVYGIGIGKGMVFLGRITGRSNLFTFSV